MRAARFANFVFCILIVFVFAGCSQGPSRQTLDHYKVYMASDYLDHYKVYEVDTGDDGDDELDHYKVYSATGPPQEPEGVILIDQFIRDEFDFIPATAGEIEFFAIPASKTRVDSDETGSIGDMATHLTWYGLDVKEEHQITVEVTFRNQLNDGEQIWKIRGPVYLLVPTDKTKLNGSVPGTRPNRIESKHFLCYEVIESIQWTPPDIEFIIVDQIDENENVAVTEPRFLCAPVEKTDEDGESSGPIDLDGEHLACYRITPKGVDSTVEIRNQLVSGQFDELSLKERIMLCVPSDKIDWVKVD